MKVTVIDCDSCGIRHPHAKTVSVYLDRRMDAAGSMDDIWENVDLCPDCMARELMQFLDGEENVIGHVLHGEEWVARIKRK